MDPFSIISIVIVAIVVLYLGRILSFIFKFLLYAALVVLIFVFVFGVSLNSIFDWIMNVIMWVF
ncbi:MAG: hypothetical protein ABH824_07050 [Nanoarchaeota archaeon]|nr:hypothetical protein [Nanoarchaeota archaeon]MBU1632369.1 hypothetical protein [Nanoarchaeota archaeon]